MASFCFAAGKMMSTFNNEAGQGRDGIMKCGKSVILTTFQNNMTVVESGRWPKQYITLPYRK